MILETVGIKNPCYNWENTKFKIEKGSDTCNKGDVVFVYESNRKKADFKTGTIENFKLFQDRRTRIALKIKFLKGN